MRLTRTGSVTAVMFALQVLKILEECFGCSLNSMGFKVLPSYLRIIQGDGIDLSSVEEVRNPGRVSLPTVWRE